MLLQENYKINLLQEENKLQRSESMKKKIFVIDDEPAILEVISLILVDAGYKVKISLGGRIEALAKKYLPDLILLTIWISGKDSRNICKNLKGNKLTGHIPIILISTDKDTEKIAKDIGADDFLSKPFEIDDLLFKVKKYTR